MTKDVTRNQGVRLNQDVAQIVFDLFINIMAEGTAPPSWQGMPRTAMLVGGDLFTSPPAAQGFARHVAAVCSGSLMYGLADRLRSGQETPGWGQVGQAEAQALTRLASRMRQRFGAEALTAFSDTLWEALATGRRMEHEALVTEQDLWAWEQESRTVDASEFMPLDSNVAREVEAFTGKQRQVLLDQWRNELWEPAFAASRLEVFRAWQSGLDVHAVAQYCAAAGATIRGTLLDAGKPGESAGGRVEGLSTEPTLVVFAYPESALAMDVGLRGSGGLVRLTPQELAQQVATYCHEEAFASDFAWRATAWCLAEKFDPALPNVEVLLKEEETAEVRLAT